MKASWWEDLAKAWGTAYESTQEQEKVMGFSSAYSQGENKYHLMTT